MTVTEADDSGLVVVDKPKGWTSHQVVARCRRLYGTRRVGHAGTLDPMATGVLLVGVNRATRLLGYLAGHDKSYAATIRLGQSTTTDDAEGDVVSAAGTTGITEGQVGEAVTGFIGRIAQVPSAVSAIKVNGKRAYARVRAGEQVDLAARQVVVSRFDVLGVRAGRVGEVPVLDVDVAVDCSAGTYVRALARDLGALLGSGGHLTALRRTRIGGFDLSMASLDEAGLEAGRPVPLLGLAEIARRAFPVIEVDAEQASDIGYGRSLALPLADGVTGLIREDRLLAIYRPGPEGRSVAVAVMA